MAEPSSPRYPDLGRRVAQARLAADLTQAQVASRAGKTASYIAKIEAGNRQPRPVFLRELARVLELDYNELLALAGHIPTQRAGEPIMVEPEDAPWVRWILSVPIRSRELARRLLNTAYEFSTETRPNTESESDAGDESTERRA